MKWMALYAILGKTVPELEGQTKFCSDVMFLSFYWWFCKNFNKESSERERGDLIKSSSWEKLNAIRCDVVWCNSVNDSIRSHAQSNKQANRLLSIFFNILLPLLQVCKNQWLSLFTVRFNSLRSFHHNSVQYNKRFDSIHLSTEISHLRSARSTVLVFDYLSPPKYEHVDA